MRSAPIPSLQSIPLGNVIATRVLQTANATSVEVLIGQPVRLGDDSVWACPYQINGLEELLEGAAFGVDGVQAIQQVSLAIRRDLERTGASLRWLDMAFWETGFPELLVVGDDRELEVEFKAYFQERSAERTAEKRRRAEGGEA